MPEASLPRPVVLNYAVPFVPAYFLYMLVTIGYMYFATDVLLIAPGVIGTIFFLSKIWDAVSDPLVGFLSDQTKSRLGRRRSWMLFSAVPFGGAAIMMWSPPSGLSQTASIVWVAFSLIAFYTTFTAYAVPQLALGAELSPDPLQRARLFGARQIGLSFGMLFAFAIGAPLIVGHPEARTNVILLSTVGAVAFAIIAIFCARALPPQPLSATARGAQNPFTAVRDVARNPHARLLLFVYFIEVFGIGGTSVMTPYVLEYVTDAASAIAVVFIAFTAATTVSIPFWVRMSRRFERHRLWLVGMALQAVGYGSIAFQDEGRLTLLVVGCAINGFGTGCGQTLGYAIKADIIDYDELKTGERKEGTYYATWNLASKTGTGLMIALGGWALQWSGYVQGVPQTDFVKQTILFVAGGVPFICIMIGMLAFTRFSLDSKAHQAIRAELDQRAAASATTGAAPAAPQP
ncbi:MAG: MFS transporter [Myxococcota bacterium]